MHIGKRIKKNREYMNIEYKELAKGIISHTHLINIEKGKFNTSNEILIALANKMNVPQNYLLKHKEENEELKEILLNLKENIDNLNLNEADNIIKSIQRDYSYINSIYQEAFFFLLLSYYHFKDKNIELSFNIFEKEFLPLINDSNIEDFTSEFRTVYYYMVSMDSYYKKEYYKSYKYLMKNLPLIQNNTLKAMINFNIALVLFKLNRNQSAIMYAKNALDLHLHENKWAKVCETYVLLGAIYVEENNFKNADRDLMKALEITDQYSLKYLKVKILHNLGIMFNKQNEIDKSLEYFNKSINLRREYKINPLLGYRALLEIFIEKNLLENFNKLFYEAKEYVENDMDKYHLKVLEAKMNLKQNQHEIYETYMKESIKYFYKHNLWKYLDIAEELGKYYQQLKKYKLSSHYFKIALEAIKNIK